MLVYVLEGISIYLALPEAYFRVLKPFSEPLS